MFFYWKKHRFICFFIQVIIIDFKYDYLLSLELDAAHTLALSKSYVSLGKSAGSCTQPSDYGSVCSLLATLCGFSLMY